MAFLGVDIGSSTTRAALIDEDFHMLALANGPTHIDDNFQTTVDDVYAASRKALDQVGFRFGAIDAICISVSGVADDKTGRVFSPVLHWIDPMPVRTIVHRYVSVPVFVSNDATAAAIGEAHYGSGMSYGRFALLRMGTLIEIAMASDGAPFESDLLPAQVATEGEFLLEAHELRAHEEGEDGIDLSGIDLSGIGLGMIRSSQVTEEARRGNPIAIAAMDWLAERITDGLVETCCDACPEAAIISGATQRDQLSLGKLITRKLAETRSAIAGIPIECSVLGNDAKAFGAAIIALQRS